MTERVPRGAWAASMLALGLCTSCGAGVVAVVASSGSSGGGTTPALDAFRVVTPKVSPSLLVLDASQAVRVGLFYDLGQGPKPMTHIQDITGNEVDLPASEVTFLWDFARDLNGASFMPDVKLIAMRGGTPISGGELTLSPGLGNDAPEVRSIDEIDIDPDEGEASGTTGIELTVADSSEDVVSVRVEFDVQGDVPDAGWQLARPALLDPGLPTPQFGIAGVQVARKEDGGTRLSFFWDTDALTDLKDLERDVQLRFTPDDRTLDANGNPVGIGESMLTSLFRVDNNAPPIVQLDSGPLILNPDERRGIPIPFRVIDEEGDLVEMVFQWRHEGEEFPSLDRDGDGKIENAEVDEILADKELRQQFHVCTEYPHFAQGRVVPIDDITVRLPELAASESWIFASGIIGKRLELLRPSSIPQPITPTWRSNPLVSPIAALPVGDGLTALVLDVPGNGRLREIELATGEIVREIATFGPGIPTTMAFERREKAVLVALDDAGTWRIERVELATGAITELIVSDGTEPAPVRGIASLGTHAAVFTAGSSLLHLDYRDPFAPQLGQLLTDLATPWGVVVDPQPTDRLYVSERDANRVLAVELDSHGKLPLIVKTADMQPGTLVAPEAIALERRGSRMLIVTRAPGGGRQLLGLDLGATGGNLSFPLSAETVVNIASVASDSDGLRLLCLSNSNVIAAAGGIEQRRMIASHSTSTQEVSLESSLDPLPTPGQPWRIRARSLPLPATAQGTVDRFLWDSADAPGSSFLRAFARDNEIGAAANGVAPKRVRGGLEIEPLTLGDTMVTSTSVSVATADCDGDGDLDFVSASEFGDNLTVFSQLSPGIFGPSPLLLGDPRQRGPRSVGAADLDCDGDHDLVSANQFSHNLTVFFQLSPGSFSTPPLSLGGSEVRRPFSVSAADLDGDGDQDLVSGNRDSNNLTVFFQLSPGSFSTSPLPLGGAGVTNRPLSVAAADLDGDGDQDLVSANQFSQNLTIFFQLSPGRFSISPLVLGGLGLTSNPLSVATADFDGDGDMDVVSANELGENLTVFFQLSRGVFSASPLTLSDPAQTPGPRSIAAADLDGDGDQDFVSANANRHSLTLFFQDSPQIFSAFPLSLGGFGVTSGPRSVAAADLDGDGDQDLVSANHSGDNVTVFLQLSRGSFSISPLSLGGIGSTFLPVSVAASDLDGDGDQDLVSANRNGGNLTIFRQLSSRNFSASPVALDVPGVGSPSWVAAADIDGDGDQDLVSANEAGGNLTVFFQLSPGNFSTSPLVLGDFEVTSGPVSVAAADLDGDGDQDLVSANRSGYNLTVFLQLSPGSLSATPLMLGGPEVTGRPYSVAVADLDRDGDQDLVSANEFGGNLTAFFQLSPASFSASPLTLGGPGVTDGPFSVAATDLDADGDQDVVSANRGGNNLTVFFQQSLGSFSVSPLTLGGPGVTDGPFSVAAADLDLDGYQDLVSNGGDNLTVFFQLSPGSFSSFPLSLGDAKEPVGPASVAATDVDGDGDKDIVSANADGNNLTVYFGGR